MSLASQTQTIDDLTSQAVGALADKRYSQAEGLASKALTLARDDGDYQRMAVVIPTLSLARAGRLALAIDVGTVTILDEPFDDDIKIEPGCYLMQPPLVGAHARRLRLTALRQEISAVILCREPVIRLGLVPLVALGNGATVRTKVRPPEDLDNPSLDWFTDSLDALGEAATELDPGLSVQKRVDALLARLDSIPEYDGLHQCLEESCREAAETPDNSRS
jgi:hypothetical protein